MMSFFMLCHILFTSCIPKGPIPFIKGRPMMSKKGLKGIMLVALAPQQGMFLGNWSGLQKKNLGPEQWSSRQSLKTSLGQSSLLLSKHIVVI